jgi:hypothetical protein
MTALPSGAGQKDKAHSASLVLASDHDLVQVKSPDHSSDATFAMAVWVGTVGTGTVSTDPDPNVTPPAANRILRITPKRDGVHCFGGTDLRMLSAGDGTSIVLQPWFYDDTQARWIRYSVAVTLTTATSNTGFSLIGAMLGAKFFVQCTANTGVSAFAYDMC